MERIGIDELKPGMFVSALIDKNQKMSIKQCGVVRSEGVIEQLKKKGIFEVMVEQQADTKKMPEVAINPIKQQKNIKRPDVLADIHQVRKVYDGACRVQKNIALKIHDKKALDVAEIELIAGQLISEVINNPEALWFMTRIRKQDAYLMEHSLNVGIMLGLFAQHLGFEETLIQDLLLAGFLHDVGKIMIPDKIINKAGPLTEAEYRIMKGHVILSREIVENQYQDLPGICLTTIVNHHEKVDGSGYPEGYSDVDIPFYGKMISIVDVFDALTAKRCYKDEMTNISALRVLMSESGKAFDPYLVTQFIKFIGTYPAGTLVEIIGSGFERLAIIVATHETDPLTPKVKVFYNSKTKNYMEIESLDLAAKNSSFEIKRAVTPQEYNINMEELVLRCMS